MTAHLYGRVCVCVCVRKRQHIKLVGHSTWPGGCRWPLPPCPCPCHWPEHCGKSHFLIWLLSCKNIKSALRKSRLFFTRISDILRSTADTSSLPRNTCTHTHTRTHAHTHRYASRPMSSIPETEPKLQPRSKSDLNILKWFTKLA